MLCGQRVVCRVVYRVVWEIGYEVKVGCVYEEKRAPRTIEKGPKRGQGGGGAAVRLSQRISG